MENEQGKTIVKFSQQELKTAYLRYVNQNLQKREDPMSFEMYVKRVADKSGVEVAR